MHASARRPANPPEPHHLRSAKHGRIRQILEARAFRTAHQPLFRLSDDRVVGVECLTRFQVRPYRSPREWFQEARDAGLGLEAEFETLAAALEGLTLFPAHVFLAFNVSPDAVLDERLAQLLDGVDAGRVVLELTEHARVEDYPRVRDALLPLRERGVRLAIDDVGAGYASMQHILNLQPDLIKIDIGLTRNVHLCPSRTALVAGLVQFARTFGATVVAEGIESSAQLRHLNELGLDWAQGFLLARPLVSGGA